MPWYGGKFYLAQQIISEFPQHHTYVEPFGGGASVLLNKSPSKVEVYNDLDRRISRLFRVLRDDGEPFQRYLQLVPYSEVEFEGAKRANDADSDIRQAAADFVLFRQSFSAAGKSWSFTRTQTNGGKAGNVNAWLTAIDGLPEIIDRLRQVQITNQSAIRTIQRFDHEGALFFVDPPYVPETRAKPNIYKHEMSREQHIELAKVLKQCKGKVILCGYPSALYDELYGGWRTRRFDVAKHGAKASRKSRATEVLWMNF